MFLPIFSSSAVPTVDLLEFLATLHCSIFGVVSFLDLHHRREQAFYIALMHSHMCIPCDHVYHIEEQRKGRKSAQV